MYKFKNSVIAFFGLLVLIGATNAVLPGTGCGQTTGGTGVAELDDPVARGSAAFNNPPPTKLGGNGRACADCHMPSENFQLSPAAAKARFDALQAKREHRENADDPLFRPVDADDFV
jgi:hypothetical protein